MDASGKVVSPGDVIEQATVALANLLAVLAMHGAGAEHLMRTTIYVVGDRTELAAAWAAISAGLAPHRPPSTLLGVAVLGFEDQLVEIDGIAAISGIEPRSS